MAKGSYSALSLLSEHEELVTAGLLVLGTCVLILVALKSYVRFRDAGRVALQSRSGLRTRAMVAELRRQGALESEFTFEHAVELAETGTIRKKELPEIVRRSMDTLHVLYDDEEHGALYQFEMGGISLGNIEDAERAAEALQQRTTLKSLRETRALLEEFEREMDAADGEPPMDWYDDMSRRVSAIGDRHRSLNATRKYEDSATVYLSRHAPHLLPLS